MLYNHCIVGVITIAQLDKGADGDLNSWPLNLQPNTLTTTVLPNTAPQLWIDSNRMEQPLQRRLLSRSICEGLIDSTQHSLP